MRGYLRPKHRCSICKEPVFVDSNGKATTHYVDVGGSQDPCVGVGLAGVAFGNTLEPVSGDFEADSTPYEPPTPPPEKQ